MIFYKQDHQNSWRWCQFNLKDSATQQGYFHALPKPMTLRNGCCISPAVELFFPKWRSRGPETMCDAHPMQCQALARCWGEGDMLIKVSSFLFPRNSCCPQMLPCVTKGHHADSEKECLISELPTPKVSHYSSWRQDEASISQNSCFI